MSLNVLSVGGSRHIGYHASLRLLSTSFESLKFSRTHDSTGNGATVTFLMRSPSAFDSDEEVQKYVKQGTAKLVKGDALVAEDFQMIADEMPSFAARAGDEGGPEVVGLFSDPVAGAREAFSASELGAGHH